MEPWGDSLEGIRSGVTTAAIYNAGLMVANPKRLKEKPFFPEEFYVGVNRGKPKVMSIDEQRTKLDAFFGKGKPRKEA